MAKIQDVTVRQTLGQRLARRRGSDARKRGGERRDGDRESGQSAGDRGSDSREFEEIAWGDARRFVAPLCSGNSKKWYSGDSCGKIAKGLDSLIVGEADFRSRDLPPSEEYRALREYVSRIYENGDSIHDLQKEKAPEGAP